MILLCVNWYCCITWKVSELAVKHGLEFFTSSTKTGEGVEDLFSIKCKKCDVTSISERGAHMITD